MNLFSLAFKNLFRYTKRTVITAVAIAFGIMIYIMLDGLMMGIEKDSERNLILYETGSAKLMHPRLWEERDYFPLKYTIDNPDEVISGLSAAGFTAVKRISFAGEIFCGEGSKTISFVGIDPVTDETVFRLSDKKILLAGTRYVSPGKPEIMIGERLAKDLGIKQEDVAESLDDDTKGVFVDVRTRTKQGIYETLNLKVTGIVLTPNPNVNSSIAMIPIDQVDDALTMEGSVTDISVGIPEWKNFDKEMARLNQLVKEKFPGLIVKDWKDLFGDIEILKTKKKGFGIMLFLLAIIAAIGISNTMLMAVFERVKEIGMMRSMGMKDSHITRIFCIESAGIGLLGAVFGLVFAVLINIYMVHYGIDFSAIMGDIEFGYRIYGVYKSAWNPSTMISTFIIGVLMALVFGIFPARRAIKMSITECLQFK